MSIEKIKVRKKETDKLFNFRPLFFMAIFLCFGITFAYLRFRFNLSSLWKLIFLPITITPLLYCAVNKGEGKKGFVLLLALFFLIGEFGLTRQIDGYLNRTAYSNTPTEVIGVVENKRDFEDITMLVIKRLTIGEKTEKGKLIAYLPPSFAGNMQISDKVFLRGKVRTLELDTRQEGDWLRNIENEISYELTSVETCNKIGETFELFAFLKNTMCARIYEGMDETSAAATVALLIGDMSGIEEGLMENIRYGGIAHVFSVSGMNVGALYAFCLLIINWKLKGLGKISRFVIVGFVIFVYTGVCGFVPSVTRAGIICLIAYANKLFGRKEDFLESLGLSAILILLFNPISLFNLGFQLSFMACLGLALFTEPFAIPLRKVGAKLVGEPKANSPLNIPQRMMRASVDFFCACIGAQLATTPIQVNAFGYLSGWSLLLNCLFVPLISAMFGVMLVMVTICCLLPSTFASVLLYAPSVVWSLMLLTFETADFSTFAITGLTMGAPACVCYYGALQFLGDKWNISKGQKWSSFAICLIAFGITMVVTNV